MSKLPRWLSPAVIIVAVICLVFIAFLIALLSGRSTLSPSPKPAASQTPTPPSAPAPTPVETALPPSVGPTHLLPDGAHFLGQITADLDGDAETEYVLLAGFGPADAFDSLGLFVVEPDLPTGQQVAFDSGPLVGERAEPLQSRDINADSRIEVLSLHSAGTQEHTMYILTWRGDAFDFLRPRGGQFDGLDHFGETGVRVGDVDGDAIEEIFAAYGPAAWLQDVYRWDGTDYVFDETMIMDK
ncbi:MAG TPA: hypothetical protein VM366_07350 [Anaerolineae bacterium]|nr:hypothetical protein [Anaerolineae bacterium]